jgi:phenylpropionate dioxygenase-like ring-hydroxylating dioxygenase large terminal subunit
MEADPPITKLAPNRAVDNCVYTDPSVFDTERDRIFDRVWNFACHVGVIAKPGDYLANRLVDVPILVVRGRDGEIHG